MESNPEAAAPRNKTFNARWRKLFHDHPHARLQNDEVKGPLAKWNPTRAQFDIPADSTLPPGYKPSSSLEDGQTQKANEAVLAWRARDNRKGKSSL